MPKMCAILQLISAPLNPIPIAEHFRRSHPQCEHSYGQHIYMSKENNAMSLDQLNKEKNTHPFQSFYRKQTQTTRTVGKSDQLNQPKKHPSHQFTLTIQP